MSAGHFFPRRRAEAVGGILRRTLDHHGLTRRLGRHFPMAVWTEAVGRDLASRARPTVLSSGTLHLLVQDHRWRDQLDAARHLIIARVNHRLGRNAVHSLQFGLAPEGSLLPSSCSSSASSSTSHRPSSATVPGAHSLPSELRGALLRAASSSLRRSS